MEEHASPRILPTIENLEPSSGVVSFINFLNKIGFSMKGNAIDIGSGKGRNAIYLAKKGYEVYCIDYIHSALDYTKKVAEKERVSSLVHVINAEIDKAWPFKENFFDLAVDCFSSIDIETKRGRIMCRDELWRTLKPGGLALVMVVSINDEMEKRFLKESPSGEKNSVIWPNGKFQKNYDREELRNFYKRFKILKLKEITKRAFKLGKNYTAKNYWMVFKKSL